MPSECFADAADAVHLGWIAQRTLDVYERDDSTKTATASLPR